tara:strand:+ start:461 stop:667 length:207 start_codon:yes stop_codon:yes gene_type:complete
MNGKFVNTGNRYHPNNENRTRFHHKDGTFTFLTLSESRQELPRWTRKRKTTVTRLLMPWHTANYYRSR